MRHAPPVVRLAVAFGAGAAWTVFGAPFWLLPLAVAPFLRWPIGASPRPLRAGALGALGARALWPVVMLAGALSAHAALAAGGCPPPRAGAPALLEGRFLAAPRAGSAPLERSDGCGTVTVVIDAPDAPAGRSVRVEGRWRQGARTHWLMAGGWRPVQDASDGSPRWAAVRWRDHLVDRIERLYGERAPLVAALTLARREGFDPELRQTFARTGLAHLLAISGFHVGVIAGLFYAILALARVRPRRARVGAAAGAWAYVALIGFPDAACRAALILAFVAASRARGRPPARWGALASALLVLLVLDPRRVASVGFQLSFAGAAGLVAWSGPVGALIRRTGRGKVPEGLVGALASGVAATVATLPIVAWHFEQVSIVGIPGTLVAGPLVAVALPGAIVSIAADFVSPTLGAFLAGGVGVLLSVLAGGAEALGDLPWAAVWATRTSVVATLVGVGIATWSARRPWIGGVARRGLVATYVCAAVAAWPVLLSLQGRGSVEVMMIDVGQGDAIAVRGPNGGWVLVDAGPPGRDPDPGAHPAVRALRGRGVRRLEALVLTHADLDHIGGAAAVLESFEVGAVYDPALPAGKEAFVDVLDAAGAAGVPWLAATTGMHLDVGGLTLEVLSPSDSLRGADAEANEASVVLLVRYGSFEAFLTGDAYRPLERALAASLPAGIEVLKVGHHGSDTSTDPLLLDAIQPSVALVSAGRGNRYGHPTAGVLESLRSRGIDIWRTDRDGTVTVVGRRDGRWSVR